MPSKEKYDLRITIYDEEELVNFIKSQKNITEYILNLARMHMNGDLILNAKESIEILRKEKLQIEISLKKSEQENNITTVKLDKMKADTRLSNARATYYETFQSEPSQQAKEAIKYYATGTKPKEKLDEDCLRCPDCTWCTDSRNSIQWQIDRMIYHVKDYHKRNLTEEEADAIARLIK